MIRALTIFLFAFLLASLSARAADTTKAPLGFPTKVTDLYIPGSKVEVIPRTNNESSLVIRILETKPAADGFRYDLEVYALDPGTHRLADFLRYAESQEALTDFDALFEATTVHPLDSLPSPSDPASAPPDKLGGYQTLLIVFGVLWLIVFLFIIFYRKKEPVSSSSQSRVLTPLERIQSLVTKAAEGELSDPDRAQLERLLLGHWKQKLPQLACQSPAEALVALRAHPEASPLVLKLEEWLHSPQPDFSEDELAPLLEPYLSSSED